MNHIYHEIDDIIIKKKRKKKIEFRPFPSRMIFVHILAILLIFCGAESMSAPYENSIFNI